MTGADAACLPRVSLGEPCTADSQCPANSWCSDVPGYRVCAPRVFSGTANTLEFALVPSGTFTQGNPDLNGDIRERPYTATLTRNYFVSRTEVTQGQWKAATGGINPSCFQSTTGTDCSTANSNDAGPVETIDWYSALAFANWLSAAQGLPACYTLTPATCAGSVIEWADGDTECTGATFAGLDCAGYRLLTESEWERAARGGSTWYWYFDGGRANEYAWVAPFAGGRTRSVAQGLPNLYGLFDTAGNVWEFAWDWVYAAPAYFQYPITEATDYLGPDTGLLRALRGGGWNLEITYARVNYRSGIDPSFRLNYSGFRVARTAPPR